MKARFALGARQQFQGRLDCLGLARADIADQRDHLVVAGRVLDHPVGGAELAGLVHLLAGLDFSERVSLEADVVQHVGGKGIHARFSAWWRARRMSTASTSSWCRMVITYSAIAGWASGSSNFSTR